MDFSNEAPVAGYYEAAKHRGERLMGALKSQQLGPLSPFKHESQLTDAGYRVDYHDVNFLYPYDTGELYLAIGTGRAQPAWDWLVTQSFPEEPGTWGALFNITIQPQTGIIQVSLYTKGPDPATTVRTLGAVNDNSAKEIEPHVAKAEVWRPSDFLAIAWRETLIKEFPGQGRPLKYIILHNVLNQTTKAILKQDAGGTCISPWPGKMYDVDSEIGAALVGSPLGCGLAYMLLQHHDEFPKRTITKIQVFGKDLSHIQLHLVFHIGEV